MIFMRLLAVIFTLFVLIVLPGCLSSNYSSVVERNYYSPWEEDVGFAQVVRVGHMLYLSRITIDKEALMSNWMTKLEIAAVIEGK